MQGQVWVLLYVAAVRATLLRQTTLWVRHK
eukprot:SAG11_NODE_46294_length_137_cov_260.736842_1_plen_29_part_10